MSNIIKEEELLLEKKLTTDFTFGFELEAVWLADTDYDDDEYDEDGNSRNSYDSYAGDIENFFIEQGLEGGDLHGDCSLDSQGNGVTFEWASPVLPDKSYRGSHSLPWFFSFQCVLLHEQ